MDAIPTINLDALIGAFEPVDVGASGDDLPRWCQEPESAASRLLAMVLLLAIRDGASEVRFEPRVDATRLSYVIDGHRHDLVPPPAHLGGPFVETIRQWCGGVASPRPRRRFLPRGPEQPPRPPFPEDPRFRVEIGGGWAVLVVWPRPTAFGHDISLEISVPGPAEDAHVALKAAFDR